MLSSADKQRFEALFEKQPPEPKTRLYTFRSQDFSLLHDIWQVVMRKNDDGSYEIEPEAAVEMLTHARQIVRSNGRSEELADKLEAAALESATMLPHIIEEEIRDGLLKTHA